MNLPIPAFLINRPRVLNALHALYLIQPRSVTIEQELACLERHARGRHLAVEIGSAMGVSAKRIAQVLAPGARLFCVDPYTDDSPMWAICKRGLQRAGVLERITFLRGLSSEVAAQIPSDCDFFFVDGDHSYEGLRADWQIVLKRLAPGGIACFHDTTIPVTEPHRNFGAVQFFHDVIVNHPEFEHLETSYSLNVIRRVCRL